MSYSQSDKLRITVYTNIDVLPKYLKRIRDIQNITIELQILPLYCQEYLIALREGLKNLTNLIDLNINVLRGNHIKEEGCELLAEGISHMKYLQHLTLNFGGINEIGQKGVYSIFNQIQNMVDLRELHIKFDWGNYISPEGCLQIRDSLKNLKNLRNLSISIDQTNEIGAKGAEFLGQGFQNLQQLEILSLTIIYNEIGEAGAIGIGEGFKNLINLQQLNLTIGNQNNIGTNGLKGLMKHLPLLPKLLAFELNLESGNNLDSLSIQELGSSLFLLVHLEELTISLQQYQITEEGTNLFNSIGNLINLKKLSLEIQLSMNNTSISYLFQALMNLIKLCQLSLELTLDTLQLGDSQVLTRSLLSMQLLEKLKLNIQTKQSDSLNVEELFNEIPKLTKLEELYLEFNAVLEWKESQFYSKLVNLQRLKKLELMLQNLTVSQSDFEATVNSLKNLHYLQFIFLYFNQNVDYRQGKKSVSFLKRKLKRLVKLYLHQGSQFFLMNDQFY